MRHSAWMLMGGLLLCAVACRGGGRPGGGGETDDAGTEADSSASQSGTSPSSSDTAEDDGTESMGDDDDTGDDTGDPEPPPPTSPKAHVRFKGPQRLAADLGQALELPADEVCFELGDRPCTDEVHRVTLGGVEPYALGVNEPAKYSSVTSPIAVDRVVIAACARRVDADFAGSPVVFDVPLSGANLSDVDGAAVTEALHRLYRGGLLREATADELDHLRQLYADVEAAGTASPARDWAVASCFAVLSSMEFLFY